MRLCSATQSLQIGMAEGVTTTAPDFSIDFTRMVYPDQKFYLNSLGVMPSGAYVVAVAAPFDNVMIDIEELNVYNGDTVTHNVLVSIFDIAVGHITKKAALTAGQSLHYSKIFGWIVN